LLKWLGRAGREDWAKKIGSERWVIKDSESYLLKGKLSNEIINSAWN